MWVPKHFKSNETAWPAEAIDSNPFALLVTNSSRGLTGTHLPVLIAPEDRERARFGMEGVRVLGHLARENPQWSEVSSQEEVLLVIGGPNAYVSPTLYKDSPAAPTWNYISVHLRGAIRWIHEAEEMMRIIDLTIDRTELNEGTEWDREPSRTYFEKILHGIVGFEIVVSECDSTFKLSQDQPVHRRELVAQSMQHPECGGARNSADLIDWTRRANPDVFGG